MKQKTRELVLAEARGVMAAAHGRNAFYSLEEARERLNAVANMAVELRLLTVEEVEAVKRKAKEES